MTTDNNAVEFDPNVQMPSDMPGVVAIEDVPQMDAGKPFGDTLVNVLIHKAEMHSKEADGKRKYSWKIQAEIISPESIKTRTPSADGQTVTETIIPLQGRKIFTFASLAAGKEWGQPCIIAGLARGKFDFNKFGEGGAINFSKPEALVGASFQMLVRGEATYAVSAEGTSIMGPDGKPIIKETAIVGACGSMGLFFQAILGPAKESADVTF